MKKNRYRYVRRNGVKIRLHRYIMQEHLGRELSPNEHIYFLNGDPEDLRIENLVVITKQVIKNEP